MDTEAIAVRLAGLEMAVKECRAQVARVEVALHRLSGLVTGNGKLGLAAKVSLLWSAHLWLIGGVSSLAGAALTVGAVRLLGL
ncbi:MAG: hypothetical protein FJZ90_20160 [Chloroflexi bacterium]|nr:hypothetical protein [Chloroflexota bacterium]